MSTLTLFLVRWKRRLMHDVRGELEPGVWLTRTSAGEPVSLDIPVGVAVSVHPFCKVASALRSRSQEGVDRYQSRSAVPIYPRSSRCWRREVSPLIAVLVQEHPALHQCGSRCQV